MVAPAAVDNGRRPTSTAGRLSHYEHLPRPVRERRNRTSLAVNPPFTRAAGGAAAAAASDVSSSLVSPADIINATPRPKSPRQPRPNMRPDLSAARMEPSVRFQERQSTARASNLRTEYFQQRSRSAPTKARAKSPIQPQERSKTPQPILAAEHFQSAVIKNPQNFPENPQEERSHREMNWKTTDVTISGDSTTSATTPSSDISSPPRMHPRRRPRRSPSPPRSRRRPTPTGTSRETAAMRREPNSFLRGCVQGGIYGGALLGNKFTECLYLSADVYQQECGPHQHRGGDRQFLRRRRSGSLLDEDDNVEDDPSAFYSLHSGNRSKVTAETDRSEDATNEGKSKGSSSIRGRRRNSRSRSRSTSPSPGLESETKTSKTPPTPYRSNRKSDAKAEDKTPIRRTTSQEQSTPTRKTYHRRHDSFDVAPHAIRYDQGEMPRLHAVRPKTKWEDSLQDATTEFEQLRNYRLSMFRKDSKNDVSQTRVPEGVQPMDSLGQSASAAPPRRLEPPAITPPPSETPQQPTHKRNPSWEVTASQQEGPSFPPWRRAPPALPPSETAAADAAPKEEEGIRKELDETKRLLKKTRGDLEHAQELAVRQQADTQTRASQLASEKLAAESRLQEESREKQELLDKIGKLQQETAHLKSSLQNAQKDTPPKSPNRKPPRSPRGTPPVSPTRSRGKHLGTLKSSDRALADDMYEEISLPSSRDEDESREPGSGKRTYDSGAVLNLVREVVRGNHGSKSPPSKSPTSVMEDMDEKTPDRVQNEECATPLHKNSGDDSPDPVSPFLSSRLISLRSELVDVRSQLAEADAARIKAEARREEVEEINKQIQAETRKLREEVKELKELVLTSKMKESETERMYVTKVEKVQKELIQTNERAQEEERAKEKLEEELTETQNEADELRGEVARFMAELERTKNESEEKLRVSDSEAKKLQDELRTMKEKLSQTNSEIVQQAAEHLEERRQIEAELEQNKETATSLQRRVLFMDDQLTQAETETEHLRSKLSCDSPLSPSNSSGSSWRKSFAGMADTIRSLSDGMGDGPIIIPEAPPKDSRSSVIERLRNSLETKTGVDGKSG